MEDHLLAVQFILIQSGGRAEQRVNAARTHTASRHAPGTHTPTHPAHVFHARARAPAHRRGGTERSPSPGLGPDFAWNLCLCLFGGCCRPFSLSTSKDGKRRRAQAWRKNKKEERSLAGAACRLASPATSHILGHQMKARQVAEDGSRAVVSLFRPPRTLISAHFLDLFSLFFVSHDASVCRVASTAEDAWLQTTRDPTHAPLCEECVVEGE